MRERDFVLSIARYVAKGSAGLPLDVNVPDLDKSDERLKATFSYNTVVIRQVRRDAPETERGIELTLVVQRPRDTEESTKAVLVEEDTVGCRSRKKIAHRPARLSVDSEVATAHQESQVVHSVRLLHKSPVSESVFA